MGRADELGKGIAGENPIAVLLIGLCPAAAVSARVIDALWMSAGVASVLLVACFCMSLVARWGGKPYDGDGAGGANGPGGRNAAGHGDRAEPLRAEGVSASRGRWWGALLLSSCLTACFEIVMLLVSPSEGAALGIYVPLIAVNCLVLGRIDAVSAGKPLSRTMRDAAGNGIGFAACLVLISLVREVLGAGTITLFPVRGFSGTITVPSLIDDPVRALGYAGGALLCIGYLAGAARAIAQRGHRRQAGKEGAG
jgi:Na+-translocating ferredoxin:NAD+ oxidoreductase subunit E